MCWSLPQMLVLTSFRITPCSHLRDPRDNLGKSIDRTSTLPGPTYTTPRLLAIWCSPVRTLECMGSGFRHSVILLSGASADTDRADNLPIALQGDTAGENHHAPMIGHVNSEKLGARL